METNATRMCALLVGLPDVNVLAVEVGAGRPLRVHVETTATTVACAACGTRAWLKDRCGVPLTDLALFGRAAVLVWAKRRWRCPDLVRAGDRGRCLSKRLRDGRRSLFDYGEPVRLRTKEQAPESPVCLPQLGCPATPTKTPVEGDPACVDSSRLILSARQRQGSAHRAGPCSGFQADEGLRRRATPRVGPGASRGR